MDRRRDGLTDRLMDGEVKHYKYIGTLIHVDCKLPSLTEKQGIYSCHLLIEEV